MSKIVQNQRITDTEKRFLQIKEQVEVISLAQKRLKELGDFGFYIPCHPTIDVVEYEKHMDVYLSQEQKAAYQKWKKEHSDMANFFAVESDNIEISARAEGIIKPTVDFSKIQNILSSSQDFY